MKTIKEVIVVEGKNDSKIIKSYFNVDTIETHGLGLTKETIKLIEEINNSRGIILLLDPDSPGEKIRYRLNNEIKGLKNAFIFKEDARTSKKVGVEHATKEVIEKALENLVTYKENDKLISEKELIDLGYMGQNDSYDKRLNICKKYHLGKCNFKTFVRRVNLVGLSKKDL